MDTHIYHNLIFMLEATISVGLACGIGAIINHFLAAAARRAHTSPCISHLIRPALSKQKKSDKIIKKQLPI